MTHFEKRRFTLVCKGNEVVPTLALPRGDGTLEEDNPLRQRRDVRLVACVAKALKARRKRGHLRGEDMSFVGKTFGPLFTRYASVRTSRLQSS